MSETEKTVSDFVQKHFVSATNVSQFAQPKKHHGQQCTRRHLFPCVGLTHSLLSVVVRIRVKHRVLSHACVVTKQ